MSGACYGVLVSRAAWNRWAPGLALAVTLALVWGVAFLRELDANADTERDLLRTLAIVRHGVFPANGPAIDYLPLSLPPTWYYLMAPALALSPDPVTVHFVHATALLAALLLLARSVGPGGLLLAALAGTSTWAFEVLAPVWHNGLVPAAGLAWLAGLLSALNPPPGRSRVGPMGLAWAMAALACQVHVVGFLLLPACAVVHWRVPAPRGAQLVAGAVVVGLTASVGAALWGQSWAALSNTLGGRTGGLALDAAGERVFELLGSWPFGAPVLILAVGGLLASGWPRWLFLAHTAASFVVAAWLSGLDPAPRYFAPCVLGIYGLAALGLRHWCARDTAPPPPEALPERARWAVPGVRWAAAPVALAASWALWVTPTDEPLREAATPSLEEQRAVFNALRPGLAGVGRVHGVAVSGLTAARYLAVIAPAPGEAPGPSSELFAAPQGFPEPLALGDRQTLEGTGRRWTVGTFARDVTLRRATVGGRPCPLPLPYQWSALRKDELAPWGASPAFDAESCRRGRGDDTPIHVELETPATSVVVVLAWFDVVRHRPERAFLRSRLGRVTRLEGGLYRDMAVFRVDGLTGGATIEVGPLETLAVFDVYGTSSRSQ